MKSRLLLDVVVLKSAAILELLSSEDESLLVWGNAFLVLNLSLDVLNGVGRLNIKSDGLACEGLHEDLHATAKAEHQVESGFLLDVVILEGPAVLELLSSEDKSLLIWRNALLVLDLGLDVLDSVRRLNVEGDGLASKGLNEDLHASTESKDEMESALLLNVVVLKSTAVLKLLASENEALLVRRDALLILNLGLHVLNGVAGLHIKSDGLASQSLHEDLHASTESQNQVEGALLLDVVVLQGAAIFELLAREDESLLIGRNSLLVLDLGFNILDSVRRLNIECDSLAGQGFDEDLHFGYTLCLDYISN